MSEDIYPHDIYGANFKIGLFAIGLDTYWEQFDGLKEQLEGNLEIVAGHIDKSDYQVVNGGIVDSIDKAFELGFTFYKESVQIIFIYVSTYALSATVVPVVQRCKVPVVILNLSPHNAIDYTAFNQLKNRRDMTGKWLEYCSACPVPEISNVFKRIGIRFYQVTGVLSENSAVWSTIKEWIEAAHVVYKLSVNRLGLIGHYYSGMVDVYTDLTNQYKYFGGHIELLEVDEIVEIANEVRSNTDDIREKIQQFREFFDIREDCSDYALEQAAITGVSLDRLVNRYKLGSIAYYYKGEKENKALISSLILGASLLTGKGVPIAGEYEVKNVQAMKILDLLGVGGSFTEFYAMDYDSDVILMGHDGPGHIKIAESNIKVRPLEVYHGKVGEGLSVEMTVKKGPVTLLSLVEGDSGSLFLLVAEAESVDGPILHIGNTNSRYKFNISVQEFVEKWSAYGPSHHCAIGVGHVASKLFKIGQLMNMEVIQIC